MGLRYALLLVGVLGQSLSAQDLPFVVKLTNPMSTATHHKDDPIYGRVLAPVEFQGDSVHGHVIEVKAGKSNETVLSFTFDTLLHGGVRVPVASVITSVVNAKGQAQTDDAGVPIRPANRPGKGPGPMVQIDLTAAASKVMLAAGAQFNLSVRSRSGPDLASLAPNAAPTAVPAAAVPATASTTAAADVYAPIAPPAAPADPPVSAAAAAPAPVPPAAPVPAPAASPAPPPAPAEQAGSATEQPQLSSVKIDFVPGERTVFFDDFSDMAQDEPPPHWKLRGHPVELKVGGTVRELYAAEDCDLTSSSFSGPVNFTFEVEWTGGGEMRWGFQDKDGNELMVAVVRGEPSGEDASVSVSAHDDLGNGSIKANTNQPVKWALWVQQGRVRTYLNGQRLVDVNQVKVAAIDHVVVHMAGYRPNGIRSVRFAESAPDFSTMMNSAGKYVTHGITFDTDSDRLKPESAVVLKAVVAGLTKNPNLKLAIDGYTDSVGNADHNLDLSKRRAAAVKSVLVSQFGVDAGRLSTNGFGAAKPIESNDTADGRAENRRVEFVKQ